MRRLRSVGERLPSTIGTPATPIGGLEYRLFQLRDEVARFDEGLRAYLDSPRGRFAQWLAERERRAGR